MPVNKASPKSAQSELKGGRPALEQIRLWLDQIRKTGQPEDLSGLIWTEPPKGSVFCWLTDEVIVPVEKREDGEMIACPFCSHGKPKFKKGRFCWFPAESATRFLGNVCARRHLDEDLLRKADAEWRVEKLRRARDAFLRVNCAACEPLVQLGQLLRPRVSAVDRMHADLVRHARGIMSTIRRYARNGILMADEHPPGATLHTQSYRVSLGTLAGKSMLSSHISLSPKLEVAIQRLQDIARDCKRAANGELSHMDQERRAKVEILLTEAHGDIRAIIAVLADFRDFFSDANIDTFNRWAAHPGSDIASLGVSFFRQNLLFVIRQRDVPPAERPRITLPPHVGDPPPKIMPLA